MAIEPVMRGFTDWAATGTTVVLDGVLYVKTEIGEVQIELATNRVETWMDEKKKTVVNEADILEVIRAADQKLSWDNKAWKARARLLKAVEGDYHWEVVEDDEVLPVFKDEYEDY